MYGGRKWGAAALVALVLSAAFGARPVLAVPSFSLQTGTPCSACHIGSFGPQLTPFGRAFKIGGYTFQAPGQGWQSKIPLSVAFDGSFSHSVAGLPADQIPHHYGANNNFSFDDVTMWIAGRVTDHTGGFLQLTHSGVDGSSNVDMADLRPYTTTVNLFGSEMQVGISVNNAPTTQDPWNSIPTQSFPFKSSNLVPTPTASPMLESGFVGSSIGTTAYAWIDRHLYLEAGAYNSFSPWLLARFGNNFGVGNTVSPAPYLRGTYEWSWNQQTAHLGAIFMYSNVNPPSGVPFKGDGSMGSDQYVDYAIDGGYEYLGDGTHIVVAHGIFIHEVQTLVGSAALFNSANGTSFGSNYTLNEIHSNVSYWYQNTYGATFAWQRVWGPANPVLYQPGQLTGSANSKPNSNAFILEADWVPFGKGSFWTDPWVNLIVGLQYTFYTQFNGGSTNYDGFGRNANGNNTLFIYARLAF